VQNIASCHGQLDGLSSCSDEKNWSVFTKIFWRLYLVVLHTSWHIKKKGFSGMAGYMFNKLFAALGLAEKYISSPDEMKNNQNEEVLNLQPGEWVEIKSEREILSTLDQKGRYKGLGWMCNMRNFCGKRYRVFKRLETMILESNRQYRKVKNTVLLENVLCDGKDWYGCDRSCFHFWREIWLKRVTDK